MIFQSWPMMPSFVYITIAGLMFCDIDENIQIKINIYPQREVDFQKLFNFTDKYILFSKIQINCLKSQAEIESRLWHF